MINSRFMAVLPTIGPPRLTSVEIPAHNRFLAIMPATGYQLHPMTYSIPLPTVLMILALLLGALGVVAVARTARFQKALLDFPRNRMAGMALAAIALLWAGWLISQMQVGFLEPYKWTLYLLTPLTMYLVIFYLDELLAPRALGGLLLIVPTVVLDAARWQDSPLRYLPILVAYLWIIQGILLVLAPYKFRRWSVPITQSKRKCQWWGWAHLVTAGLFAALGLFVF